MYAPPAVFYARAVSIIHVGDIPHTIVWPRLGSDIKCSIAVPLVTLRTRREDAAKVRGIVARQ